MSKDVQAATSYVSDKPALAAGGDINQQRGPFRAVIDLERVIWDNEYRDKVREMLMRTRS